VSVWKRKIVVQIEAAGFLKPEAQQRYVEDFKNLRTKSWAERCLFQPDTKLKRRLSTC
jgi:hypothetical protein